MAWGAGLQIYHPPCGGMFLGSGDEQREEQLSEPTLTLALVPLLLPVGTSLRLDPFTQFYAGP